MNFEDKFPTFEKYTYLDDWDELINWDEDLRGYDKDLLKQAIIENCIDKQRLLEALNEIPQWRCDKSLHDKNGCPKCVFLNKLGMLE